MTSTPRLSARAAAAAVVLVAVSMALTLALAEFGLRLAMPTGYFIWKPRMERTFHPAPEFMPGVTGVSTFRTNSQGLRADELTGQEGRRILAARPSACTSTSRKPGLACCRTFSMPTLGRPGPGSATRA